MRIGIVDDEPLARERLRRMLAELPGYEVVGEAADGAQALAMVAQREPDVVLLDIRIGGLDGLQVARRLAEDSWPPAVIFTTAYAEHALTAFEVAARGYLLKPVRREKLLDALQRVQKPSRAQRSEAPAEERGEFITATTREGLQRVPLAQVICFVADNKYTAVRHRHGELLIEEPLVALEERHGARFLRIHRNALVAAAQIVALERDGSGEGYQLRARYLPEPLPVSRRRIAEVRRALLDNGYAQGDA